MLVKFIDDSDKCSKIYECTSVSMECNDNDDGETVCSLFFVCGNGQAIVDVSFNTDTQFSKANECLNKLYEDGKIDLSFDKEITATTNFDTSDIDEIIEDIIDNMVFEDDDDSDDDNEDNSFFKL